MTCDGVTLIAMTYDGVTLIAMTYNGVTLIAMTCDVLASVGSDQAKDARGAA